MSDPELQSPAPEADPEDRSGKGPSLILLYSLIALAMAVAIGFAVLIVLPFHHRH